MDASGEAEEDAGKSFKSNVRDSRDTADVWTQTLYSRQRESGLRAGQAREPVSAHEDWIWGWIQLGCSTCSLAQTGSRGKLQCAKLQHPLACKRAGPGQV